MPVYTGKKGTINLIEEEKNGGQTGIRTLGGLAPTPVFKTGAFNHSAICPALM